MMNLVAGATARQYNRRKGRSGAFWEDTYQATAVESGEHLWRCLRYVDLNMFRAGIVEHPSQWRWCGYDELMGTRSRYRILAFDRLMEALGGLHPAQFREAYAAGIQDAIDLGKRSREQAWTDSFAVGSRIYVERVAQRSGRRKLLYDEISADDASAMWCVREDSGPDADYEARNGG